MIEPGSIMRHVSALGRDVSWFVVAKTDPRPTGKCLIGLWTHYTLYIPEGAKLVPNEEVPDEVWAALAKWRLLDGIP